MSRSQVERQAERSGTKRRRISPVQEKTSNTETSSSGSDLEASTEADPALSSSDELCADGDETSSSGSDDSTSDTEHVLNPPLNTTKSPDSVPDIHNRLTSFFSQLAEQRANPSTVANEIIEENSSDSGYEDGEEGKQYIELDLALGVLSEDPDGGGGAEVLIPGREDGDVSEPGSEEDADMDDGQRRGMEVLQKLSSVNGSTASKARHQKRKVAEVG